MATYSTELLARVDPQPEERLACFEWRLRTLDAVPHQQSAELALGVALRIFRVLAGDTFTPDVVLLRHPPVGDPAGYAGHFGCPVRFETDHHGFLFRRDVLHRPLSDDVAVHQLALRYLADQAIPVVDDRTPAAEVIRRMLPTGALSLEQVAAQLAVHPRSLQRQLAVQETTYQQLVDDTRRDEAARLLRDTDLPLAQIAHLLGYTEQSVFSAAAPAGSDQPRSDPWRPPGAAAVVTSAAVSPSSRAVYQPEVPNGPGRATRVRPPSRDEPGRPQLHDRVGTTARRRHRTRGDRRPRRGRAPRAAAHPDPPGAQEKYVTNYRRAAAGSVARRGGRGHGFPTNQRDRDKAEVFELALARVSRQVAVRAKEAAAELKAERLAAARAGGTGPDAGASTTSGAAPSGRARTTRKTTGGVREGRSTRAAGARRQAKRDARG